MTPTFLGQITNGKLTLDKGEQFRQFLHTLNGKRVELTVEKLKHPRSNSQNAYYWGCIVKLIAEHTGHDPEMIHEFLKMEFSPKWYFPSTQMLLSHKTGIPTSTTRLDTLAFAEYTEKCRVWAAEFLGLQIPLPGEVMS